MSEEQTPDLMRETTLFQRRFCKLNETFLELTRVTIASSSDMPTLPAIAPYSTASMIEPSFVRSRWFTSMFVRVRLQDVPHMRHDQAAIANANRKMLKDLNVSMNALLPKASKLMNAHSPQR
jgi:hypothetical protein